MPSSRTLPPQGVANSPDFSLVALWFEDPEITELFAHLLMSRGVDIAIVEDAGDLIPGARLITEPQFLPRVPQCDHARCLIIGGRETPGASEALYLSQPLTEDKIERALHALMTAGRSGRQ